MTDTPNPIAQLTAAVNLPADKITIAELAALARDLVTNLYDQADLLKKHEITAQQLAAIKTQPFFQKLLEDTTTEWNKPKNINERLALEAAAGLERAMPAIIKRMQEVKEPLPGVVQAAKLLSEVAGTNAKAQPTAGAGEKFSITINLGADQEVYEKTRSVTIEAEAAPSAVPVQPLAEGAGEGPAIQPEPKAS